MELGAHSSLADSVELTLRAELSESDAAIGTIAPVLRHLIDARGNSVFADDVVAGVRGMVSDIARQVLDELANAKSADEWREHSSREVDALTAAMAANPAFLGHIHALAVEWQLTQRLQSRLAIDPVIPPLLQGQMASPDPQTSALAMNLLAAQARFCQSQRRMKLPLSELPGDLLQGVLQTMRTLAGAGAAEQAAAAEAAIRAGYDEARSRLGIISRLVSGLGGEGSSALSIGHAGAAIFLSALALASGQDRDLTVISTNKSQPARLALALSAAGLKHQSVQEQFLTLHPDTPLPQGFEQIGPDRAAAILAAASPSDGV